MKFITTTEATQPNYHYIKTTHTIIRPKLTALRMATETQILGLKHNLRLPHNSSSPDQQATLQHLKNKATLIYAIIAASRNKAHSAKYQNCPTFIQKELSRQINQDVLDCLISTKTYQVNSIPSTAPPNKDTTITRFRQWIKTRLIKLSLTT